MIWVDFLILGIVLVSTFISLIRGFVKEALSFGGWVAAVVVALMFTARFSELFKGVSDEPLLRYAVSFVTLLVLTLIATMIINVFASQLIKRTGLTSLDRFFGVLFGFFRGILLVLVLVVLGVIAQQQSKPWWKDSLFITNFEPTANWAHDVIVKNFAR